MADKSNALSKKTIIAIVAIIVLLFIAGLSVGIFLADKGRTEAVDGNQTVAEENQTTDGNQATDGDQNADENQTDENQTADADQADGNNQEENNDNQTTTPDNNGTVVENNETANNGVVNNNVENNDGTANNNATNNNTVANNNGITTNTDVNEVGETTVTRVEEQERLVSRDYLDWWTPTSVVAASASRVADKIVPKTPDLTVEKTASTGVMNADGEIVEGTETLVYAGQNITYTIRVTNNGSEDIENIEITDKIPQNTTFVSFDNVYNIVKGTEIKDKNDETVGVKWVVSVPGHEENEEAKSVIVKFTVKVNEMMQVVDETGEVLEVPTTGTIANTAIANGKESNEGEPTKTAIITNNKSSVITRNGEVVETAKIGDRIKYTITVTNTGDVEGSTYISDNIPAGTKLISVDGKEISSDEKLTSVNWTVQLGAKGTETATVSKEFVVEIESINGEIKNIGDVGGTPTNEDKNETGNLDVVKTASNIKRNGENVEKDEDGNVKVEVGDVIEYTITITNTGSLDIRDVVVDEQLIGLTIESLTVDGELQSIEKNTDGKLVVGYLRAAKKVIENEDGEVVTPAIPAGKAVITATYTVVQVPDVTGNPDKTIYNKVVASGTTVPTDPKIDPEPIEGEGDETVIVEDAPSLEVNKTATGIKDKDGNAKQLTDKVRPDDVIEYTIKVTNTGNTELKNVVVTDTKKVSVYVTKNVDGEEVIVEEVKELEEQEDGTKVSTVATIPSIGVGKAQEIKVYYTVTTEDVATEGNIYNKAIATADDGTTNYGDDNTVVVNPDTTVKITKIWNDNNDQDGKRPEKITVNVFGTDETTPVISNAEISVPTSGTTYTFTGLPKYDEQGNIITYTVTENEVIEYTTLPIAEDSTVTSGIGYIITNKHTPEVVEISVEKEWADNNNEYGIRQETVNVSVIADGYENSPVASGDLTVGEDGKLSKTFGNLPKYKDRKKTTYTVKENNVAAGYVETVTKLEETDSKISYKITNTVKVSDYKSSVVKRLNEETGEYEEVEKAKIGDRIIYTIHIENETEAVVTIPTVTDKIPAGTELVTEGLNVESETITWSNVSVPAAVAGETGLIAGTTDLTFEVKVVTVDGEIENTARVGNKDTNIDIVKTVGIDAEKEVVDIKRTVDGTETSVEKTAKVQVEDVIEYKITVENTGSEDLVNVILDEQLAGVEIKTLKVDGTAKDITFNEDGRLVIGELRAAREAVENEEGEVVTPAVSAGKAEITATYKVTQTDITGNANKVITNTVVARGETIPEEGKEPEIVEDTAIVTTQVEDAPSLEVDKTATGIKDKDGNAKALTDRVRPGDVIEYTIKVTNTGNTELKNVVVTDTKKVSVYVTKNVDGEEVIVEEVKELEEQEDGTKVSTVATIPSIGVGKAQEIKVYYTVTTEDVATEGNIYNKAIATADDGTTNYGDDNTVVVNPDTTVKITKIWNDNNDQDGKRPEKITVNVFGTDETTPVISNAEISVPTSGTTYTFTGLPKYDEQGNIITYTVTENEVIEYTTLPIAEDSTVTSGIGYIITNKHTPEVVEISVEKEWADNNNEYGIRQETVNVSVIADGYENSPVASGDLTVGEDGKLSKTFGNLPKYKDRKKTTYTVKENNVAAGYVETVTKLEETDSKISYKITNTVKVSDYKSSVVKRLNEETGEYEEVEKAKIGDRIIYTIHIENETEAVVTIPTVTDKIPAGTELVTEGLNVESETITWSNVSVPAAVAGETGLIAGTTDLTFEVKVVTVDGEIENTARVGNKDTNIDIVKTVGIDAEKEVVDIKRTVDGTETSVEKTAKVQVEDVIEYKITVENTGSEDLVNVILDEQLAGVEIKTLKVDGTAKDITFNEDGRLVIGELRAAREAVENEEGEVVTPAVSAGKAEITATYKVTQTDITGNANKVITNTVVARGETIPEEGKEPEIVEDTAIVTTQVEDAPSLEVDKKATDAEGNEITKLTYDPNTPSSKNFNYVLTVTSQETLKNPQTVTDILPTGITVDEEWKEPANVTVTTDPKTGKQIITWEVDLSEPTSASLTIPVVASDEIFKGNETGEEKEMSVLELFFHTVPNSDSGIKTQDTGSTGVNIFLRSIGYANQDINDGYIYAGSVEVNANKANEIKNSATKTKFVSTYTDATVNNILENGTDEQIENMLTDFAKNNADTENGLGQYLKNGLPKVDEINQNLKRLYGDNIQLTPTQIILWYKIPYSTQTAGSRHYQIFEDDTQQEDEKIFDGTINLDACSYHIDGIIVDVRNLGGYIPEGITVPVTNTATLGKIYDNATVDITYKPSELTNISVRKEWVDNNAEKPSVTVQLFADGVEEGEPVVLNAENSWSYYWTTLYKNNGEKEIEYTVKEIKVGTEDVVENETSKYISTQKFDEKTRTVTITNTRKAEIVSTKTASTENGTITVVQGQQETAGEIPVEIGDTIEYTITVENKGALTEKDVTVQDTNPQHTTPISGSALEVTFNNGTTERKLTATEVQEFINGTFKVDVPAYTIFTFKFSVKVTDGSLTDKITNTAYVGENPVGPTINSIERTVNVTKYKNNIASTNIILVLDVSSSMNNSRIVDARNAINTFVENTYAIEKNKNVTFTLLTFANRDYTEGKGATKGKPAYSANQKGGIFEFNDDGDYIVTYDNKDEFTKAVRDIVTDSGTNIRAGLEVTEKAIYGEDGNGGIAGMEKYKDYEQIVIFFGDGEPYGETEKLNNETGIKAKADDIRKKGAKIFSIGFGSDVSKPNSTGYKVLSKISDDGKVYTSSNYTDLVRDFSKIVGTDPSYDQITVNGNAIINITSNAQDIIVDADNPIIITVGGVSTIITSKADATANHITYTNKQITWDVSSYSESEALTITYYVQ